MFCATNCHHNDVRHHDKACVPDGGHVAVNDRDKTYIRQ